MTRPSAPKIAPRQYTDRHGQKKLTHTLYADVTFADGTRRAVALGADRKAAVAKLREILGDIAKGKRLGPTRLSECLELLEKDYARHEYTTVRALKARLEHIRRVLRILLPECDGDPHVGGLATSRRSALTRGMIEDYQTHRMTKEHAAAGTVELETCAIGRALRLARDRGDIDYYPAIPHLYPKNARKGWYAERGELEAIIQHLPRHVQVFAWAAYYTAWRPVELLTRQDRHLQIDPEPGWLVLENHETKNGQGRATPLMTALRCVLREHLAEKDRLQRERGIVIPWLFYTPDGNRLSYYWRDWDDARRKAGMPNRLLYDCRGTRITLNDEAGVGITAGMQWAGHTDMRTHLRYTRSDKRMLARAVEAADQHEGNSPLTKPKVAAIGSHEKKA